jgi:ABC-2 type transport system permease protein
MYHVVDAVILVFSGLVIPLQFMPDGLQTVAKILPFSYIVYYPAASLTGIFSEIELLQIILGQVIWLMICIAIFQLVWAKGIKKYTGVGI